MWEPMNMKTALDGLSRTWAHVTRSLARTAVLAIATLLAGCGATAPLVMTPQHVEAYGTAVFEAQPDTVFQACVLALQMSGQRIEVAEPSMGLVVTSPDGRATWRGKGHHGYLVEVKGLPDGRASVVATPAAAGAHASVREGAPPGWGVDRERMAWERLFTDIRDIIDRAQYSGR